MKQKVINRLCTTCAALLLVGTLTACGKGEGSNVVFTTGFAKDELFRIGEVSCTVPEYMLYLTNTQNKYEDVFGEEIWKVTSEGMTLEDNMKDIVLAEIAQMKSVYLLAKEKEVVLTEEEEALVKTAATKYYSSLSEAEIGTLGISVETVEKLYREKALADKVYQQIIAGVNPEISDDEARTVTVEQILIKTHAANMEGKDMPYSESMKEESLKKIQDIWAMSTEQDFTTLAAKYNESEESRLSIKKGQTEAIVEEVAFNLQTDEISDIIETSNGYCILKCINTFSKEETDANKLVIIEERKNQAFGKEYDAFVGTLARKLNEKLWQQVDLIDAEDVDTNSFFEVYEDCLQKF